MALSAMAYHEIVIIEPPIAAPSPAPPLLNPQVHADFEYIGQAADLRTVCLYGGTQYGPQESILRRGVDIVVGTPGRVKDHLERGTLNFSQLRFRVLDECDEMLNMGFVDDVEKILNAGNSSSSTSKDAAAAGEGGEKEKLLLQTLLFSATMPAWVKDITKRFLRPGHKLVDLVGNSTIKVGAGWFGSLEAVVSGWWVGVSKELSNYPPKGEGMGSFKYSP